MEPMSPDALQLALITKPYSKLVFDSSYLANLKLTLFFCVQHFHFWIAQVEYLCQTRYSKNLDHKTLTDIALDMDWN